MRAKTAGPAASAHEPGEAGGKPRVRDRIFETACDLFYQHGIREVGVDQIAAEAGTNKMSFYRSFGSKDELIAEYLEKKAAEFWQWWDGTLAAHAGDTRAQILALFDGIASRVCAERSRGCALANASVELSAEDHPGRRVAIAKKREMRRRLRELAAAVGTERPEELGDALMLLMEGSFVSRLTLCSEGPARQAGAVVRQLLEIYAPGIAAR